MQVIDGELIRNVILAMVSVYLVTLVLITDVFSAFQVVVCVTFSLVRCV